MSGPRRFLAANAMLASNFLANVSAVILVVFLSRLGESVVPRAVLESLNRFSVIFTPLSALAAVSLVVFYERPIRTHLRNLQHGLTSADDLLEKARRRLLNEPYLLITFNIMVWLVAAVLVYFLILDLGDYHHYAESGAMRSMFMAMISAITAFFVLEWILQKLLAPILFPQGGLWATKGTIHMGIGARLTAQTLAGSLVPVCFILLLVWESRTAQGLTVSENLASLQVRLIVMAVFFAVVAVGLTVLVAGNLIRPFREIVGVLTGVKEGNFTQKVRVSSNDEIGYTSDVINDMTDGLMERDLMRRSLELAREVQLSLLPRRPPAVEGLDVAGRSIYCDRTGGDYYDFLTEGDGKTGRLGLVIGDVSDHGIQSALMMTTARAFLRLRSSQAGGLAEVVTDVNHHLSLDTAESGQFMTLFLCEMDRRSRRIRWVSAGHDPAWLYDSERDVFEELKGRGVVLGLTDDFEYSDEERDISPGHILVAATDGIWEAHNSAGEMFGKDRFRQTIREYRHESAESMVSHVIDRVREFRGECPQEDDVTLIVVKVLG